MTAIAPLPAALTERVLRHFGLPADPPPNLNTLGALVAAYTRKLPWESASRIVRRAEVDAAQACALFGADFWQSHFQHGTGGTCYESNYAFFGLLRRLGYQGYLTINDIGGALGCHSAIVLLLDGDKYLVDVGFPLYIALPLPANGETTASCSIMDYRLAREDGDSYQLQRIVGERVHGFRLHDRPVDADAYRDIAIHDYRHDGGQFLNEVVIHKIVAEELWRFHSDVRPLCLQQFVNGQRIDHELGDDAAAEVAAKFSVARAVVAGAFDLLVIATS